MRTLLTGAALLAALASSPASAQPATEVLATCLTDNTTGRDRKDLARWIFTAMAAHPDIDRLSAVTAEDRATAAEAVGAIFTRLFAESCTEEIRAAVAVGGSTVIGDAFGMLGEVAVGELMQNAAVSAAMADIVPYVDMERLEAVFAED